MSDLITSKQNANVKLVYGLQNRTRTRRKEHKIVLEGARLVGDALAQGITPLLAFFTPSKTDYDLISQLQQLPTQLIPVSDDVMQHMSDTESPQGVLAVCPIPKPELPESPERVLILDEVREPGNMGTILRTAGAAGVQIMLLSPGCVDPYNPKVLRSGMGAHFRLPIVEAKWYEIAEYCADVPIYLAAGGADLAYSDVDWAQHWALVIGNEAHGVGKAEDKLNGTLISIPMAAATESLNAAVATGVILFEAQRQRNNN